MSGVIDIMGTAKGTDFQRYILYYSTEEIPTQWIEIVTSTNPVDNAVLYKGFNTNTINKPIHYLQLKVWNVQGEISEDRAIVLPQSKLVNTGASILTGQLLIQLQGEFNGNWQSSEPIVNTSVSIPANGLLKLDTGKDNLGNTVFPGFNNLNVKVTSFGDYRVHARFEKNGQFVESNWEFKVV